MTESRKTGRKARQIPYEQVRAEWRKDPAFRDAYDALEEEFSIMSQLIKARTEAGLTQEQVAERMQSTQSAVARMEGGGCVPSTRTLRKYAEATGHRLRISFERQPPKS